MLVHASVRYDLDALLAGVASATGMAVDARGTGARTTGGTGADRGSVAP